METCGQDVARVRRPRASRSASFVYDGDSNRVQSTINGTTTTFIGNYYEYTSGGATKYYYAGSQRVAMRACNGTLYFMVGDQLGSTSMTTNSSGNVVSSLKYKAWGEVRDPSDGHNPGPSNYSFTGQYSNVSDFGLLFYNARFYDPGISQFVQPDTLIPDTYNPQSYNRYMYAFGNPVRYSDPTGHRNCDEDGYNCGSDPTLPVHNKGDDPIGHCVQNLSSCYMQGWTNAGSAWSTCMSHADFGDRLGACSYDVVWTEAHAVVIVGGVVLITYGAGYFGAGTVEGEAETVSIGSNGLYQQAGYTYFQVANWAYNTLKVVGLGGILNTGFMANQIDQDKDVIVTLGEAGTGPGTQMELQMIEDSGKFIEGTANWLGATKIYQISPWQY